MTGENLSPIFWSQPRWGERLEYDPGRWLGCPVQSPDSISSSVGRVNGLWPRYNHPADIFSRHPARLARWWDDFACSGPTRRYTYTESIDLDASQLNEV